MDHLSIHKTSKGLHVEGYPDAVKVFQLKGEKEKRLADLALHMADLNFALSCLESINSVPVSPDDTDIIRQALWRSAVIHFFKCFGKNESRFSLKAKNVYKGDKEGLEVFKHLKSLRDKHLVHDRNPYAQCLPGAILNKRELDHKIAKIVCLSFIANTLDQSGYSNLHLLCTRARAWAEKQFNELCELLTQELEQQPYDELNRRPGVTYSSPSAEAIHQSRALPK